MDLTFGKGGFVLKLGETVKLNNREFSIKDLSDQESEIEDFTSDEKNCNDQNAGQYWNPDLLIKNCTKSEWDNIFTTLLGQVVNFTPFSDNPAFNFDCTVLECFPTWEDGKYWKCDVKIKLASVMPVVVAEYDEPETLFFLGDFITPPVDVPDTLFFLGELI